MSERLVCLVPGFFGFTSVGAVSYFERVERTLAQALRRRGVAARVLRLRTQPTASIRRRAEMLRREVMRRGGAAARELHFVGHSAGGLDVRVLLAPGARLSRDGAAERIGQRTRSAVLVATPHHGTPLAKHLLTLQGQTLLLVLSALATSGPGRGSIVAAARAIALVARLDDWLGREQGPLDRLADSLLRRIQRDRRDPLWQYLAEIERDQGALLQLTPEGADLLDAAVADRPGVDYGCVVVGVPPPQETSQLATLRDPDQAALRALFRLLHALTATTPPRYPCPLPAAALRRQLDRGLGFASSAATNDGIVPTWSQLHGRLLHVACADHLDIVGHYTISGGRTADWLPSGAGFTSEAFEAAWDKVAEAIARNAG